MFKILIPLFIMFKTIAGVGGIAGGNSKFQEGDKILFQRDSTFVSANYSRSLCHDGQDYLAMIRKCAIRSNDSEGKCLEYQIFRASQPMESKRRRCNKLRDDRCVEWIEVPFNQSPKRIVIIKNHDDEVIEKKKVVIPKCQD